MIFSTRTTFTRTAAPLLGLATLAVLGLAAKPAAAQTQISTVSQSTGNNDIYSWGVPDTSTYGQTFTAPTDNVLNDVSFYLGGRFNGSGPINYQAYVYAWDGSKATGSALFTSAIRSYTPTGAATASNLVYTSTGNTILTSGQQYVAFLTTAGLQGGQPASTSYWHTTDSNASVYSGGNFVYDNTGNNFAPLTTTAWTGTNGLGTGRDLEFTLDFSPNAPASAAPEPSQFAGLGFAVLGVGGLVLRARKRKMVTG